MAILLLAEHENRILSEQTSKALSAALKIGSEIDILVTGRSVKSVADAAAKLGGIRKVWLAESKVLEHQLAEPVTEIILQLMQDQDYDTLIAASTSNGKNILPRVAALLDVMQLSDIIEVVSANIFKRSIYTGNAIETVKSLDAKKVITVRTACFDTAVSKSGGLAPVETIIPVDAPELSSFVKEEVSINKRPELTSARIIVSGGRGLGSKEQFMAILTPLADKLSAAIGASRAAVDAGYAPNNWQVGQTGKIVTPELYIAVGLSGAIQHLAGMKDSRIIVAINKDEEAPIMQLADYALTGDLFKILPEFVETL